MGLKQIRKKLDEIPPLHAGRWKLQAALVVLVTFGVYLYTTPRTVTLEDSGLFLMASHFGGVAHPPATLFTASWVSSSPCCPSAALRFGFTFSVRYRPLSPALPSSGLLAASSAGVLHRGPPGSVTASRSSSGRKQSWRKSTP